MSRLTRRERVYNVSVIVRNRNSVECTIVEDSKVVGGSGGSVEIVLSTARIGPLIESFRSGGMTSPI